MNKSQLLKHIENTFAEGLEIVGRKNDDYTRGEDAFQNFRVAESIGIRPEKAILVRIADKLSRISVLLDKEASVKDETISDTILDNICYLAILRAWLEYGQKEKK